MIFPVEQPYVITTKFSAAHPGIDIAPTGQTIGRPCKAPENALVVSAGYVQNLEGHYIILRGDSGYFYYFGHFASRSVVLNQSVSEGQQIGILGMTGLATGIHTHHEVRKTQVGNAIDPEQYYKNGADMADKVDANISKVIQHGILGRNGIDGRPDALAGQTGTPWVGTELTSAFLMSVYDSPEAQQWRGSQADNTSIPNINKRLKIPPNFIPVTEQLYKKG